MKKYLKKNSSKHGLTFFFLLFTKQWGPINTEGKKQYGRDFLLKLANDPLSKQKPCNMPPMDIIKDRPNPDKAKFSLPPGLPSKDWTPGFVKSTTSKVCFYPPTLHSFSNQIFHNLDQKIKWHEILSRDRKICDLIFM